MSYKKYFYLDIETTSKYQSIFDFRLDDEIGYDIFVKKYESMKRFDNDWNKPIEDVYVEKSPMIPEFAKIICVSFGLISGDKVMTIYEDDEKKLMSKLHNVLEKASESKKILCGFNIKLFDVPFIIKKFYKHGFTLPQYINFVGLKPWEINILDVAEVWKGFGKNMSSLEEVMYELGIDNNGNINGSEVYDYYWNKKDKNSIIKHCEQDIHSVVEIVQRLNL